MLRPKEGSIVKHKYDAFFETGFDSILRNTTSKLSSSSARRRMCAANPPRGLVSLGTIRWPSQATVTPRSTRGCTKLL
jgi:hypothetical protein